MNLHSIPVEYIPPTTTGISLIHSGEQFLFVRLGLTCVLCDSIVTQWTHHECAQNYFGTGVYTCECECAGGYSRDNSTDEHYFMIDDDEVGDTICSPCIMNDHPRYPE